MASQPRTSGDVIRDSAARQHARYPSKRRSTNGSMERVKGIEPSYAAWEAAVLPLNYTRRHSLPF